MRDSPDKPALRLIHETNPRKYFPALFALAEQGEVILKGAHRYSVLKEWLRAGIKDRTSLTTRSYHAWKDFCFRVTQPWVTGETIVLGFAPWDPRLLLYRGLSKRNRIIYHTSWHDWGVNNTPLNLAQSCFGTG